MAQVYADEVEDLDQRDRRLPQHRRPRRHEHPGARSARQALREAGRRGAGHRLHDARRRPHGRRQAARRDVLPHRQGARREARRPRVRRKSASRWRSISIRRTCRRSARSAPDRDRRRPTGTARRATSIRSSSTRQAPRAARASSSSSSASSATRCSASTTPRVQAYELALQCDADNEDAALPLVERVHRHASSGPRPSRSPRCSSRRRGKRERGEQHTLHNMLGTVAAALGKDDKALKAYQAAHQLDLTDQETIRGLADVCFRLKDWAERAHQLPEGAHRLGEDETEERADVYYKLGCIKREQGQAKQAINNFEKALGVEPRAPPDARSAGRRLRPSARTGSRSAAYKRQILDNVFDGDERFKMLDRDRRHLGREGEEPAEGASRPRRGARPRAEEPRRCFHKLLAALPGDRQLAEDGRHAAAHRRHRDQARAQAQVHLHDGADLPRQARRSGRARSSSSTRRSISNPSFLEAFERINKILTAQKDWKQLERAFRKMLHRVAGKGNTDLEYNLWHDLGLIYRDRLQRRDAAASRRSRWRRALKPDELHERQILAELYETTEQLDRRSTSSSTILAARPDARRSVPRALPALPREADVRPGVVHVPRRSPSCARPTRRSSASSRTTAPQGMIAGEEPARQRAVDQEPLPRGREPLHRQDLRDDRGRGAHGEDRSSSRHEASCRCSTSASSRIRRPRRSPSRKTFGWAAQVLGDPVPGALRPQRRARRARRGADRRRRRRSPGRRCSPASRRRSSRSSSASTSRITAASTTSRRCSRRVTELTVLLFAGIKMVAPEHAGAGGHRRSRSSPRRTSSRSTCSRCSSRGCAWSCKKFIEDGAKANIKRWIQCVELTACRAGPAALRRSRDREEDHRRRAAAARRPVRRRTS